MANKDAMARPFDQPPAVSTCGPAPLDANAPLPGEASIAAALGQTKRARNTMSGVEPWRERIARLVGAGVQGSAIHAAFKREHGDTAVTPRWRA